MLTSDICEFDLGWIPFQKRAVLSRGTRGTPFLKWVRYGMPQLGENKWTKKIVFFLYHSEEDARRGTRAGGTGFLVALPSSQPGQLFVHGVTNWHNPCRENAHVIRINRKDGPPEIFDFGPDQWSFFPGGPDLAASPPFRLTEEHDVAVMGLDALITPEQEKVNDIDAAEDVFMVGRFIDYDGVETNEPAFRFGHVSIVDARVRQPTGYKGRSIVVDMHSRTGFSGSPVFMYRTPGSGFAKEGQWYMGSMLKLLGIHWGQFPELWELKNGQKREALSHNTSIITTGQYVEGLSGMTCVVPAIEIRKLLLEHPDLAKIRVASESASARIMGVPKPEVAPSAGPNAESSPLSNGESPTHREDFMRLVGAAARKPEPKD